MTEKLFTIVGISKGTDGNYKVRFANDVNRHKALARAGHSDIRLALLAEAMTKIDAVRAVIDMEDFQDTISQYQFNEFLQEHSAKAGKVVDTVQTADEVTLQEAIAEEVAEVKAAKKKSSKKKEQVVEEVAEDDFRDKLDAMADFLEASIDSSVEEVV